VGYAQGYIVPFTLPLQTIGIVHPLGDIKGKFLFFSFVKQEYPGRSLQYNGNDDGLLSFNSTVSSQDN